MSSEDPPGLHPYAGEACWHDKPHSAIIHTQNVTFTKYPGQNIRGRPTFLPDNKDFNIQSE